VGAEFEWAFFGFDGFPVSLSIAGGQIEVKQAV
jgi:hypothetical protein